MSKKAFITGIGGQSGSYLTEHLLECGYSVVGMVRRHSVVETQDNRVSHLRDDIDLEYGDLLDCSSIDNILKTFKPDEIYNLAAQSHVRISFDNPQYTVQTNCMGVVNLLEGMRRFVPNSKFYQASSSEIFGNNKDEDGFQRETTMKSPVSPYGCSKLFGYNIVKNYRHSYGLFATNGILFNHESPRRGSNFVTAKVVKTAVEIHRGLKDKLVLGNIDSYRDWGHAKDYVRGMWQIMQNETPDDFVLATGEAHSVRDLCEYTFKSLDMDYRDYVEQDSKFMRPEELDYLKGDATRARIELDWKRHFTFETLIDDMLSFWMKEVPEELSEAK